LEEVNRRLLAKLDRIKTKEVRYEEMLTDDAEILMVAFGTAGRIAKTAIREARQRGISVGLLRPISLFPFPSIPLDNLLQDTQTGNKIRSLLVVEMNAGQMVEDVRLVVRGRVPVHFYGRTGGAVPLPDEILDQLLRLAHRPEKSPLPDVDYHQGLQKPASRRLAA
jgi:2-oxoglutarate ferredoxin oxidoreductase subunit alpha